MGKDSGASSGPPGLEAGKPSASLEQALVRRLGWLPAPILIVAVAAVWGGQGEGSRDSIHLLVILASLLSLAAMMFVTYQAARHFIARGAPEALLLGCGALVWGAAALVIPMSGMDAPTSARTLAILYLWLSALPHLLAAVLALRFSRPLSARYEWLVAGYAGASVVVGLFSQLALDKASPAVFLQGPAGAAGWWIVLGSTVAAFLFAALVQFANYRRTRATAAYFYGLALSLFALGTLALGRLPGRAGFMEWAGGCLLALGSAYLALAGAAGRSPQPSRVLPVGPLLWKKSVWTALVLVAVAAGAALRFTFMQRLGSNHAFITFYPAVVLAGLAGGLQAGLLATLLSTLVVDWFWITPGTLGSSDPAEKIAMVAFLSACTLISLLAEAMRRAQARATQAETLVEVAAERAHIAEVLREREARFRLLAEASFEGIVITEGGRIIDCNDQYCRMLGHAREDLVGLEQAATLPPDERGRALPAIEARDGQVAEHRLLRRDGTTFHAESRTRAFHFEGRECRLTVVGDVTARREAQAIMARYQIIAQYARDPLLLVELDGRIVEANQAAVTFYGYSHEEIRGKAVTDLRQDEPAQVTRQIRQAQREGLLFETWHRLKDGTRVPVEVSARGVVLEGREFVLSVIRDISARKRAEADLLESARKVKAILDAATESIWVLDPQGQVLMANPTAVRRLDMEQDPVGLGIADVIGAGIAASRKPYLDQVVRTRQPLEFEDVRSGIHFHHNLFPIVDPLGAVTSVAVFSSDTTEARLAEKALRQSHRRMETLAMAVAALLHADDPQALMQSLAGQVMATLDCQVFLNYLSIPGTSGLSLFAWGGLRTADSTRYRESCAHDPYCRSAGCESCPFRLEGEPTGPAAPPFLARDYGIRAYACRPLISTDNQFFGTLAFGTANREQFSEGELSLMNALTQHLSIALENQQRKERLRLVNGELERRVAERTAEVQALVDQLRALAAELTNTEHRERKRLSAVLHDHLQQLLVAAKMQVEVIRRQRSALADDWFQGVESTLREAIEASRSLAVDLCPPILSQGGLGAALQWLAKRMGTQNGFKVQVRIGPGSEPASETLRVFLFESVRELLLNALKHSGVMAAEVTLERTASGSLQVLVEDQGAGFDLDRLTPGIGDGFGFFSIQQRVAHLGGHMDTRSAPGRGTRVCLTLPPETPNGDAGKPAADLPKAAVRKKRRKIPVLLVDDHQIVRQGLEGMLLVESDISVVGCAESGEQALAMAARVHPEVVVTDVSMPGMDGVELTRRLLAQWPRLKVIGLSMHSEEQVAEAMRHAGAVGYLTKGGPAAELVKAIRAAQALESSPEKM